MYKANIFIKLKKSVLDPQGKAVTNSLHTLGFNNVVDTRVSKFVEIMIDSDDIDSVKKDVEKICDKVLANPNIESYSYNVEKSGK